MSTYTDLHNKVKEGIVVNCHKGFDDDRITFQEVKLLNPNNQYRGTFTGQMNVENSNLVGGVISGCTIHDVTMYNIDWPGGQRIDECIGLINGLSNDVKYIQQNTIPDIQDDIQDERVDRVSADGVLDTKIEIAYEKINLLSGTALPAAFRTISAEIAEKLNSNVVKVSNDITSDIYAISTYLSADYTANDSYLSSNIDSLSAKISAEVTSLSNNMSADIRTLSAALSNSIDLEIEARKSEDSILSGNILAVKSDLTGEIQRSTQYDERLELSISQERTNSINRDNNLSNELNAHDRKNTIQLSTLNKELRDKLEQDRHYEIYGEAGSIVNTYPYQIKDFSVNIIETTIKDSLLQYNGNLIGGIIKHYSDTDPAYVDYVDIVFSNFAKFDALAQLFDDPYQARLYNGISKVTPKGYYKITYTNTTSDGDKLTIVPVVYEYYNLKYGKSGQLIGKLRNCKLNYDTTAQVSSIVSCFLTINVSTDDPNFGEFARDGFNDCYFNNPDCKLCAIQTEEIELVDDGRSFKLSKGIQVKDYATLSDSTSTVEFGNILSGNAKFENAKLQSVNVNIFENPLSGIPLATTVELNTDNNFVNSITDVLVLSATTADNNSTIFNIVNVEQKYAYDFYETTDTSFSNICGKVVPDVVNKKFDQEDVNPPYISVLLDALPVGIPTTWPTKYRLTLVGGTQIWVYSNKPTTTSNAATDWITLRYNKTENKLFIEGYSCSITPPMYFNNTYILRLASGENYPHIYAEESKSEVKATTRAIFLADSSEYNTKIKTPSTVYNYVTFDGPFAPTSGHEVIVTLKSAVNEPQKVLITNKPTLLADNSREFLLTTKFTTEHEYVYLEFVNEDGNKITFWNNRTGTLRVPANVWSTLKVQEIKRGKFLVTDLNDNEDHSILYKLSADLTAEIDLRQNQVSYLSAQHDELCSNLSITLSTLRNEFDVVSSDLYTLSNDISGISSNFDGRITQNKAYIDDIYKQIKGGLNYKGVFDLDVTKRDHAKNNSISALFYNNLWTSETATSPEQILSIQLRKGFYWILDAKQNPLSTFNYGGLKLQKNDWLIIKTNSAVSSVTSAEVDVMDAQDNDVFHLSGNGQVVRGDNFFYGKQYFEDLSVRDQTVTSVSAISLTADNALISNLTCNMELQVSSLGVNDISAYRMHSISSRISTLSVLNDATIETADISALSSNSLSSINANIQHSNINEEIVQKLSADNLSADFTILQDANVSDLTATNEVVDNISATNISVAIVDVVDSGISNLTATNEVATNLTATNSDLSNVGISNLTTTNEVVTNLTAANETVTNLIATNSDLSNANISSLVANVEVVSVLTATSLSGFELSAKSEFIENSNIDKLTVNVQADVSVMNVQELTSYGTLLSGLTEISNATVNNLSVASLSQLSVMDKVEYRHGDPSEGISCISSLQDVLDLSVDNLTDTISSVSSYIYDKHYATNLSTDITIKMGNCPHSSSKPTKIVDQLLIRDEMTFNLYRLTIRNGALNINLVEEYK